MIKQSLGTLGILSSFKSHCQEVFKTPLTLVKAIWLGPAPLDRVSFNFISDSTHPLRTSITYSTRPLKENTVCSGLDVVQHLLILRYLDERGGRDSQHLIVHDDVDTLVRILKLIGRFAVRLFWVWSQLKLGSHIRIHSLYFWLSSLSYTVRAHCITGIQTLLSFSYF